MRFREWRNHLLNKDYWSRIDDIPDHRFWSLRQELKSEMLENIYNLTLKRYNKNQANEALIKRVTQLIKKPESDILVLGFARRFATYKRATLLFKDPGRLARLLNDPEQPVLLVFAGKAHPNDEPGQELIRAIHSYAHKPEFQGRIILLEDYNMSMARSMVTGVDVWLNTPQYPLEASGTSGEKAAINGVLNLSVMDGWWGEGYNGANGWGIIPHGSEVNNEIRDREESQDLLDILENEVIPIFYNRGKKGYSKYWVKLSKASMKSCIPHYNASRMVMDYVKKLYAPAKIQSQKLLENERAPAIELANWKRKIRQNWKNIKIRRIDDAAKFIQTGDRLRITVSVYLNGLSPEDVALECLVGLCNNQKDELTVTEKKIFQYQGIEKNNHIFTLDLKPGQSGLNHYKIRMYPYNKLLAHPLETGYLIWL